MKMPILPFAAIHVNLTRCTVITKIPMTPTSQALPEHIRELLAKDGSDVIIRLDAHLLGHLREHRSLHGCSDASGICGGAGLRVTHTRQATLKHASLGYIAMGEEQMRRALQQKPKMRRQIRAQDLFESTTSRSSSL